LLTAILQGAGVLTVWATSARNNQERGLCYFPTGRENNKVGNAVLGGNKLLCEIRVQTQRCKGARQPQPCLGEGHSLLFFYLVHVCTSQK